MTDFWHVSHFESTLFLLHIQVYPNCIQIQGIAVQSYALLEEDGLTLIDGGFLGNPTSRIEVALEAAGRSLGEVKNIIVSHGHIDHTINIANLAELTGATVYAPRLDEDHIAGTHRYSGISRICGFLERSARLRFGYNVPEVHEWFNSGDELPFWGGMKVIPFPGHTEGHCGFYSEERRLLFANDLFANLYGIPKQPPPWFNGNQAQMRQSIVDANLLDLSGGVIVNHSTNRTPQELRQDLATLAEQTKKRYF